MIFDGLKVRQRKLGAVVAEGSVDRRLDCNGGAFVTDSSTRTNKKRGNRSRKAAVVYSCNSGSAICDASRISEIKSATNRKASLPGAYVIALEALHLDLSTTISLAT